MSLEVSPLLAYDTAKALAAAKELHARAGRLPKIILESRGGELVAVDIKTS